MGFDAKSRVENPLCEPRVTFENGAIATRRCRLMSIACTWAWADGPRTQVNADSEMNMAAYSCSAQLLHSERRLRAATQSETGVFAWWMPRCAVPVGCGLGSLHLHTLAVLHRDPTAHPDPRPDGTGTMTGAVSGAVTGPALYNYITQGRASKTYHLSRR